jgi:multidrug/hemolysin transport system permease protein
MKILASLVKRNTKLFFKDKGMFFTSLITPAILLVLYATFLGNVYRDSFMMGMPEGVTILEKLLDGVVGGQLFSSLLAVSCISVAFCSNFLMVQDKVTGARADLTMSPVKSSTLALGYYISSTIATLIVCFAATLVCFVYLAIVGWYLSVLDVALIIVDILLVVTFGTALSSIVNMFLSSQGQISAVGSIVSAGYGFICGAYMPISQFGDTLQKVLSFSPGTYATSLIRNHSLRGAFAEMEAIGLPTEAIDGVKTAIDCDLQFFGHDVSLWGMFAVLFISVAVLLAVYILLNVYRNKRKK